MRRSLSAQPVLGHLVTYLVAAHLEDLSGPALIAAGAFQRFDHQALFKFVERLSLVICP
jgi:hypothetical protein